MHELSLEKGVNMIGKTEFVAKVTVYYKRRIVTVDYRDSLKYGGDDEKPSIPPFQDGQCESNQHLSEESNLNYLSI